jgi:hypothetical protein
MSYNSIYTPNEEKQIKCNIHYRKYLQNNATHLMKINSNKAFISLGVNPYNNNQMIDNRIKAYYNPYIYQSSFDNTQLSRCIPPSKMKLDYLKTQQLKATMISPSISIESFKI